MAQSAQGFHLMVVGSGAREHALVWKLTQSNKVSRICVAPGNGGTRLLAKSSRVPIQHVSVSSNRDICQLAVDEKIGTEGNKV
jgi:phosphoribosylamine-glycine ligase